MMGAMLLPLARRRVFGERASRDSIEIARAFVCDLALTDQQYDIRVEVTMRVGCEQRRLAVGGAICDLGEAGRADSEGMIAAWMRHVGKRLGREVTLAGGRRLAVGGAIRDLKEAGRAEGMIAAWMRHVGKRLGREVTLVGGRRLAVGGGIRDLGEAGRADSEGMIAAWMRHVGKWTGPEVSLAGGGLVMAAYQDTVVDLHHVGVDSDVHSLGQDLGLEDVAGSVARACNFASWMQPGTLLSVPSWLPELSMWYSAATQEVIICSLCQRPPPHWPRPALQSFWLPVWLPGPEQRPCVACRPYLGEGKVVLSANRAAQHV